MMNPTEAIRKFYDHFTRGEYEAAFDACDPKATFQITGESPLAGKFDRANISQKFASRLKELSGGTYKLEIHDIIGSDRHVVALGTVKLERSGKPAEYRTAHVWRCENGRPVAGYEYFRDQYQVDRIWS
jgi:ketosteroid isomerase-like protein